MKKFKLFGLLLLTILVSCKDDAKPSNEQVLPVEKHKEFYNVTVDFIAKKDDAMHLFYTEDNSINFIEEKSQWIEYKGSENSQKITFDLPKDVLPTQLRFDFGLDNRQEYIKINSIEIKNYEKSHMILGVDVLKYFRPNTDNSVFDPINNTIKPISKVGCSLYPLDNKLSEELIKLVK